ncbi:MAG: chromosome segregation protein SMC [Synechococcus sp.]|nr:chromosome segregation protein SMC [Synechococcus sp.]
MVHIKQIELSHFKSFGGTVAVPLRPGFTVVSGPNGSGKSNILDGILFCLGLASSKGMRAERLPDLINHKHSQGKGAAETVVSVTFDLSDLAQQYQEETTETSELKEFLAQFQSHDWTVTRKLRVTKSGSYTSTYYINDQVCTATELHEQLNRLRIYPEGYNVVLQGDVTRIITMNGRERREIIDELAGVAEFDRKIAQTRETLNAVKEREEKCHIIRQELERNLDKLADDRLKAEQYQRLKIDLARQQQEEVLLTWRSLQLQEEKLQQDLASGAQERTQLTQTLNALDGEIFQTSQTLDSLNAKVKALGEDEQLSVASKLATQKAKRHQWAQRQTELEEEQRRSLNLHRQLLETVQVNQQQLLRLEEEKLTLQEETLPEQREAQAAAETVLRQSRHRADELASSSEAWVQEQAALTKEIQGIQDQLNPQRTEQALLQERVSQLQQSITSQTEQLNQFSADIAQQETELATTQTEIATHQETVQTLAQQFSQLEESFKLDQETGDRLQREQREKQRQLDQLEARSQAQQEAQGTYATKVILNADLPGVHGLVAQLGQVEKNYQRALEIAAGGRLGYLVVEDDQTAATGIKLLKNQRAGRATFLPLNKIRAPKLQTNLIPRYAQGFVDFAVNLIQCDRRYLEIFRYVFGNTAVFETLDLARSFMGQTRIVTLDGELLETTGAMTGGSIGQKSTLHFGSMATGDSAEIVALRERLEEIDHLLRYTENAILDKGDRLKELSQQLIQTRQQERETQLHQEQLTKSLTKLRSQLAQAQQQQHQAETELAIAQTRLAELTQAIPQLEQELTAQQAHLAHLEAQQTHQEWQEIQREIKLQEAILQGAIQTLNGTQQKIQDCDTQIIRLSEKLTNDEQRLQDTQTQLEDLQSQVAIIQTQLDQVNVEIQTTETLLKELSAQMGDVKKQRDQAEVALKTLQKQHQETQWRLEKLQTQQQERAQQLEKIHQQIQTQEAELPPDLDRTHLDIEVAPEGLTAVLQDLTEQIEKIQRTNRRTQKKIEDLEPVNMLALKEYEQTQIRLGELSEKLTTLEQERLEVLARIERFTTRRFQEFKKAFDAVNENFQKIFAALSDGDGYLQLDNPTDPFAGGLNLVAHPKGKPVQRLSSMSGGEKSLTALSFIFSLQRYRPSPFYAFDEVDMFLDGANVERLSKMIQQQAQQAQFLVVSLRRPMIEASQRTIGVTQARGAYTQVLGIQL